MIIIITLLTFVLRCATIQAWQLNLLTVTDAPTSRSGCRRRKISSSARYALGTAPDVRTRSGSRLPRRPNTLRVFASQAPRRSSTRSGCLLGAKPLRCLKLRFRPEYRPEAGVPARGRPPEPPQQDRDRRPAGRRGGGCRRVAVLRRITGCATAPARASPLGLRSLRSLGAACPPPPPLTPRNTGSAGAGGGRQPNAAPSPPHSSSSEEAAT